MRQKLFQLEFVHLCEMGFDSLNAIAKFSKQLGCTRITIADWIMASVCNLLVKDHIRSRGGGSKQIDGFSTQQYYAAC